ncbi:MAG: formylglycine-generating enzyme family protein [Polyangiales bacterium]
MRLLAIACVGVVVASGCSRGSSVGPKESAGPMPVAAGSVQVAAGAAPRATEEKPSIAIPPGRFFAGSMPGDEGRDPTLEPVAASYDLPGFTIDARPYPGKPGVPPLTGVTQAEAQKMCAERGARLCTELEWERACRGPSGDVFSTGNAWDPTCAKGDACVSGFGARSMGAAMEEWTASSVSVAGAKKAAVKGANASALPAAHRCAARHAVDGTVKGPIGFRCCSGPVPQTTIASIEPAPTFRKASIDLSKLAEIFAGAPELARVKQAPRFFKETEIEDVTSKAKSPPGSALTLTTEPILWSPEPGTELLIATGKSKGGAWVAAFHVLPGDKYKLASSMVFANEQGPILLAYQGNLKREILWSMSWGAPGEGGAVTYRDDHRAVIVQR